MIFPHPTATSWRLDLPACWSRQICVFVSLLGHLTWLLLQYQLLLRRVFDAFFAPMLHFLCSVVPGRAWKCRDVSESVASVF